MATDDSTTVPEPDFPHSAYGVQLSSYGEEGGMIAPGRVDPMRFIAACRKVYRTVGEGVFLDGGVDLEDALGMVTHYWMVPVPPPDPEWRWYLESAREGAPGARLYTVGEPS